MAAYNWETSYLKPLETAPKSLKNANSTNRNLLDTTDIAGARPRLKFTEQVNRPSFQEVDDIDGSRPQRLIPTKVNRPNDRNLRNDDIDLSQPYVRRMITTRSVNPLNPSYQLPTVEHRPVTPPKYIRPTNDVDDINNDPDYPMRRKPSHFGTRDHMNYKDVTGVENTKRFQSPIDPLTVTDINNDGVFKSNRQTNPLSPRYDFDRPPQRNNQSGLAANFDFPTKPTWMDWSIGQVDGSHPKKLPSLRNDRPLFSLRTDDIDDMKSSTVHHVPKSFPVNRRDYRAINRLDDIGPQVKPSNKFTTFAKSSTRSTNPLTPVYKF